MLPYPCQHQGLTKLCRGPSSNGPGTDQITLIVEYLLEGIPGVVSNPAYDSALLIYVFVLHRQVGKRCDHILPKKHPRILQGGLE